MKRRKAVGADRGRAVLHVSGLHGLKHHATKGRQEQDCDSRVGVPAKLLTTRRSIAWLPAKSPKRRSGNHARVIIPTVAVYLGAR